MQALFHLPTDKKYAIANKAVEAAAGLQSSMECTLKSCLPEASSLGLAVGIDLDVTLVSKIGTRGQRDRICIGSGVENAASSQERSNAGEISITTRTYAAHFHADRIERLARAAAYSASAPVYVHTSKKNVLVDREGSGGHQVFPAKSYAE